MASGTLRNPTPLELNTLPHCVILSTADIFVPVYIRVDVFSPYTSSWEMSPLGKRRHINKVTHKWSLSMSEATNVEGV